MQFSSINVISPKLFPDESWNETEMLGAMVWLWFQSGLHREASIDNMMAYVLPVLKNGQFALFASADRPVGYFSWACFDAVAEAHYLQSDHCLRDISDWHCGDNIWIVDWFAPFGHSLAMSRIARQLFPNTVLHALYHKGSEKGLRIQAFSGKKA